MKWYEKYNNWKTIFLVLTPIASGELLAYFSNVTLPTWVHVLVGCCAVFMFFAKTFIKDDNNNGKVDKFE